VPSEIYVLAPVSSVHPYGPGTVPRKRNGLVSIAGNLEVAERSGVLNRGRTGKQIMLILKWHAMPLEGEHVAV